MKRSTIILFLAFGSAILLGPPVNAAEDDPTVVNFLLDYGRELYDQGRTQDAAHEFRKALILDPDNSAAKAYLAKMGVQQSLHKMDSKQVAPEPVAQGWSKALEDMQVRLKKAQEENHQIQAVAENLTEEQAGLSKEISKKDKQLSELKSTLLAKDKELAQKENGLAEKENQLAQKENRVSDLNKELNQVNGQLDDLALALKGRDVKPEDLNATGKSSSSVLTNQEMLIEEIKRKDTCIATLKERLAAARKELSSLISENEKAHKEQAAVGTQGSEEAQKKILEGEILLERRQKEIDDLSARISELEQKLALNERIIREKEDDIKKLSEDLSAAQEKSR